jgi:hypothetical protein
MAGRPRGKQARTVFVPVRFPPALAAKMDKKRHSADRSTYIRRLVEADTMTPAEAHEEIIKGTDAT